MQRILRWFLQVATYVQPCSTGSLLSRGPNRQDIPRQAKGWNWLRRRTTWVFTNQLYISCPAPAHPSLRKKCRSNPPPQLHPSTLHVCYKFLIQPDPSSGRKFAGQLELWPAVVTHTRTKRRTYTHAHIHTRTHIHTVFKHVGLKINSKAGHKSITKMFNSSLIQIIKTTKRMKMSWTGT